MKILRRTDPHKQTWVYYNPWWGRKIPLFVYIIGNIPEPYFERIVLEPELLANLKRRKRG